MPILNTFGAKINESVLDERKLQRKSNRDVQFEEAESRLGTSNTQRRDSDKNANRLQIYLLHQKS